LSAYGLMTPNGWHSVVGSYFLPEAPGRARMDRLPNSLAIALWVVGACWMLAIIGYIFGAPSELIFPLVAFGILTGFAEWYLRRG
jgi:hypothetical protein